MTEMIYVCSAGHSAGLFFLLKIYIFLNEYLCILCIDYSLKEVYNRTIESNKPQTTKGRYNMNLYSYQNFAIMLNRGLADELINADEAVELLCNVMPTTFHKGEWSIKRKGGLMVLKNRLVAWYDAYGSDMSLVDVVELLQGN